MESQITSTSTNGTYAQPLPQQLSIPLQAFASSRSNPGNMCPVCHKTFDRMYNLKVHFRKHTGETPYSCPVHNCSKQFRWRSSMAHHVRAHHDASETIGLSLKTSTDSNAKDNINTIVCAKPDSCATIPKPTGIKKPQRKKILKEVNPPIPMESLLVSTSSVAPLQTHPESPPLFTVSGDTPKQIDEYNASDGDFFDMLPSVLSRDCGILDDVNVFESSIPSTFDEYGLDDCSDVMHFFVAGEEEDTIPEIASMTPDVSLRAAVEAAMSTFPQFHMS